MKRVYGYIRVSTETQADKGYGLQTQEDAITQYCKNNSLELIEIFRDEGISGALGDANDLSAREGVSILLSKLTSSEQIVVMNTSRLWRDDNARVIISRTVRKIQSNILSVEQPRYSLYSVDPQDFLFNSMMEMLDQYERMCLNLKLAKGRKTKAKTGTKPCGMLPYGYEYDKNKEVVINEAESKVVQLIFELYAKNYSLQEIATHLNNNGYTTRQDKQWSKQTIHKMLDNDFYIGVLTYNDKVQGTHDAIISEKLWNKTH